MSTWKPNFRHSSLAAFAALAALTGSLLSAWNSDAAKPPKSQTNKGASVSVFADCQKLIDEQKFDAARALLPTIIAQVKTSDDDLWTQALVKQTQLTVALSGYETAVRELRAAEWPKSSKHRAMLELYYAWSVTSYMQAYNWEIRQRTRVESKGPVDLKQLNKEQLVEEAISSYENVYKDRDKFERASVDEFAEYLSPNSFPRHIRGTLRDAVTYLFADLLANSSFWEPAAHAALFELDVKRLVEGTIKVDNLSDGSIHPLQKLAAVSADLESWHLKNNRPEAALEAHLDRLRALRAHLSQAEDRTLIRQNLEATLGKNRAHAWWGMGQALLARWTREDLQDQVLAHNLASEGERAFPNTPGAQACAAVRAEIEAPDYSLQTMQLDGPNKRSLVVSHRNLSEIHFRAYKLDAEARLLKSKTYNVFPSYQDAEQYLNKPAEATFSTQLPKTSDYQQHKTFVTPSLPSKGLWLIMASTRADFVQNNNRVQALYMQVSDLVMRERNVDGKVQVMVLSGESGRPVEKARVRLFKMDWQHGHQEVESERTNRDGIVLFSGKGDANRHSYMVVADKWDDLSVDPHNVGFWSRSTPATEQHTLIYTDRAIYRPNQKLHWKTVTFSRRDTTLKVTAGESLAVSLHDPNGEVVATQSVTSNEFGTASGTFDIPAGRLLGQWSLSGGHGNQSVRVEEYKRPTFEVSLQDATVPLRLNKVATFNGEAKYYFGMPVTAGKVKWTVQRQAVYPYWWSWYYGTPQTPDKLLASGQSALDADGKFKLEFTPTADERLAADGAKNAVSYRYSINVDLTDEGGETRSDSRSYRVGFVSVEGSISSDVGFFRDDTPVTLQAHRRTLDGQGRAGLAKYRIYALQQPQQALPPADQPIVDVNKQLHTETVAGDLLRARHEHGYAWERVLASWKDGKEVAHGDLKHDASGFAAIAIASLPAGAYRVRYETEDDFKQTAETFKEFIVAGAKTQLALPGIMLLEKTSVPVGGTIRLLVHSALPAQHVLYSTHRAGDVTAQRWLDDKAAKLIEIPVTDELRGGIGFTLEVLRDFQVMTFAQTAYVPWDNKELSIELETFRDKLKPGQHETWRFLIKDKLSGRAEAKSAELLAYMYDKSLDALAPHYAGSPLGYFPHRGNVSSARFALAGGWPIATFGHFASGPYAPSYTEDSLRFQNPYGIGGMGRRGGHRNGYGRARMMAAPTKSNAVAREPDYEGESKKEAADMPAPAPAMAMAESAAEAGSPPPPPPGSPPSQGNAGAAAPVQVRSNFSETAFFRPQLRTDANGMVSIEFDVPDSVTSYNVWLHAITKDLKSASTSHEVKAAKELMVRPYLPRFLREGDKAELKVVVNNAAAVSQTGDVTLEIFDPETKANRAGEFKLNQASQTFTVKEGQSTSVTYMLEAPKTVGLVAFKVVAKGNANSDGELRPMPLLPSRQHLIQTRFVTLRDKQKRTMTFEDLQKDDDPTRINEQMVITVDGQLFYSVLKALPYLLDYPYECSEQTLNRFLSAGIVQSVYRDFPSVAAMAKKMAARNTQLERFDAPDPNRKVLLEETPWLNEARGGQPEDERLLNLLDPKVTQAVQFSALERLRKSQLPSGGFPWFPGGPASPYVSLYLLHGFSRATEFKVDLPKDMVQRTWTYVASEFRRDWRSVMASKNCCWEYITFLNFVASSFPDESWVNDALTEEERAEMLAFSFKHWKQHSPLLKAYLALTLKRAHRDADAMLVFESVMDSAKTAEDQGTFWAQEDRSWLWYNDTIESHAFALRTLTELMPSHPKKDGLVLWLLLNKKLNHWKSTRATAEVLYSLVHYLRADKSLGGKEAARVMVGDMQRDFTFDPSEYQGKQQLVLPAEQVNKKSATITVEKETKGFMFASSTWHFSTDQLQAEDRGDFFKVSRTYFLRTRSTGKPNEWVLKPLREGTPIQIGDELEVHVSLRTKHAAEYVHLRDPRGAGFEPMSAVSRYKWDLGIGYYEEIRDSGANYFFEQLPVGEYTFKYRVRANMAGDFRIGSATVQSMYAPEFSAYSAGQKIKINPQ